MKNTFLSLSEIAHRLSTVNASANFFYPYYFVIGPIDGQFLWTDLMCRTCFDLYARGTDFL